jgi:hypothetical protein
LVCRTLAPWDLSIYTLVRSIDVASRTIVPLQRVLGRRPSMDGQGRALGDGHDRRTWRRTPSPGVKFLTCSLQNADLARRAAQVDPMRMPSIPAFCDTCGTAFPSGIVVENSTNASFSGNKSGPCPNCGGMGHIPDGVFNFIGSTIEILSAPERTVNELTRLMQILREAKAKQHTSESVATQIKRELPALSGLADLLPRNRGEFYGFLAVIIASIQLLKDSPRPSQSITINATQVIERTLADAPRAARRVTSSAKPGRNEPCPCGSGRKYKKCCGSLSAQPEIAAPSRGVSGTGNDTRRMKVIPEPKPNTRSVIAPTFKGPAIKGEGPHSYTCGSCGLTLLKNVECKQVQDIVVRCHECQSFNEIPASHHTK